MTRLRMHREAKRPGRPKRLTRAFEDDESDETIIGLGFVETRNTLDAGATAQPDTAD